ncbi:hypothetical protein FOA43_004134 [Brettanomyces nanus]|uniref:SP-RING-type domain-containing protein n=1 Tax=Eeniella nana TaxID=13502 RepID=A0A875RQF0_EENNA|nr:uncharacterized protein FOA43_004134 [Brettanomyces nanus]QPG76740.1 hypothetical protein FOA43_004134 [Brettanomyces nanus]
MSTTLSEGMVSRESRKLTLRIPRLRAERVSSRSHSHLVRVERSGTKSASEVYLKIHITMNSLRQKDEQITNNITYGEHDLGSVGTVTNGEDKSGPEVSWESNKKQFYLILKMPQLKNLFERDSEGKEIETFDESSDRQLIERYAMYLIVGVNMLLQNTSLVKEIRWALQSLHNRLGMEVSSMPLSKLRLFVDRLQRYLIQLRKVIDEHDGDLQPNSLDTVRLAVTPSRTDPVAQELQEAPIHSVTSTLLSSPAKAAALPEPSATPTNIAISSSAAVKVEPPKPKKKRKPRRRKPKMPYQRYHFPIPVEDFTTFSSLAERTENDDDLLEESMVMSLLDPISGSRFVTPLRTRFCSHIECFDMSSFIVMHKLRPFKVGIRRERPLPNGKPNVAAIFRDTKRTPLNPSIHNQRTPEFEYRSRYKSNNDNGKYNNELEFFCCPICRLEFSIKVPGDVYVVGDLVDLLFYLEQAGKSEAERVEINNDGSWAAILDEEEVKEEDTKVVEIDLDAEPDEQGEAVVKKADNYGVSDNSDTEVVSSDFDDSWDEEFRELDKMLDSSVEPDNISSPAIMDQNRHVLSQSTQPFSSLPLPPPPVSAPPSLSADTGDIRGLLNQRSRLQLLERQGYISPRTFFPSRISPAERYRAYKEADSRFQGNGALRHYNSYGQRTQSQDSIEPVFFTGNGIEDDPFVID